MHPFINIAIKAARSAGDVIMRGYDRLDRVTISNKSKYDFVTSVDLTAEKLIINDIRSAYPDHAILAEESGHIDGEQYEWIIDPLNGTTNFIHGIPNFAVSIAIKYKNRIEYGVIYDPVHRDLFTTVRGSGSFKNDRRIRCGQKKHLEKALIGTGFPFRSEKYQNSYCNALKDLSKKCLGIRKAGATSLDLAYVASGQLDGFWELGLEIWDIAASVLLIKEAGGLISDLNGRENHLKNGNIVCGNPKIFKTLLRTLNPFFSI